MDVVAVQTLEGDINVHYASPEMTVIVDDDVVDVYEYGDMEEGGAEVKQGVLGLYREDGPEAQEYGLSGFYRTIYEYVQRRRNTDKRLRLIGG